MRLALDRIQALAQIPPEVEAGHDDRHQGGRLGRTSREAWPGERGRRRSPGPRRRVLQQLLVQRPVVAAMRVTEKPERTRSRAARTDRLAPDRIAREGEDRLRVRLRIRPRAYENAVSGVTSSCISGMSGPRPVTRIAIASCATRVGDARNCSSSARCRTPAYHGTRPAAGAVQQHVALEPELGHSRTDGLSQLPVTGTWSRNRTPAARRRAATSTISSGSFCAVRRAGNSTCRTSPSRPLIGRTRSGRNSSSASTRSGSAGACWRGRRIHRGSR